MLATHFRCKLRRLLVYIAFNAVYDYNQVLFICCYAIFIPHHSAPVVVLVILDILIVFLLTYALHQNMRA